MGSVLALRKKFFFVSISYNLKKDLEQQDKNAKSTSKTIQNETRKCLDGMVKEEVIQKGQKEQEVFTDYRLSFT